MPVCTHNNWWMVFLPDPNPSVPRSRWAEENGVPVGGLPQTAEL